MTVSTVPIAYARIVSLRFRPASLDDAMAYFRDVSVPLVRMQPGSLSIIGAANYETGTTCAVSFWRTLEDLEASNSHPDVVEALTGYGQWMESAFLVESYDVIAGIVPEPTPPDPAGEWLRLTLAAPVVGSEQRVIVGFRERLDAVTSRHTACTSALLLIHRQGRRVATLEFWSDPGDIDATERILQSHDVRLMRAGCIQTLPTHDVLTITGRY